VIHGEQIGLELLAAVDTPKLVAREDLLSSHNG
jgi:hypothetical protein